MLDPLIINQYSEKILEIIEQKDEMTRSDLQGVVDAIVIEILIRK